MKIKNFDELAITEARKNALLIAEAGLQAIDTKRVLKNLVRTDGDSLIIKNERFSLGGAGKIIFIGIGKCAAKAGLVFEKILGERLTGGAVIDIKKAAALAKLKSFQGSHPLPSQKNIRAARKIARMLEGLHENDLVIFLISGGGSTLLCLPESGQCDQEISIVKALMRGGATIQETNIVRKHLSLARGGWLARYAYPANIVSLIFSDVPGNDVAFIASGPTCKDTTTIDDAKKVLRKYRILNDRDGKKYGLVETPKENKYFKRVHNILALSNEMALEAMAAKAKEIGFIPRICAKQFTGEASKLGKIIAEEIHNATKNEVFLYGGESTVKARGAGRGGRNLELGLSALEHMRDDEIIVTIASDGRDNGPFGGAVCDIITKETIKKSGVSAKSSLLNNDTYPLFEKIGNYLIMGNTGSNVADLVVAMKI